MTKKLLLLLISVVLLGCANTKLPKPKVANNYLGEMFGLDARVNFQTLDKYLFRKDSVYRDMRMLEDPANYEALAGGDRFLSGFVAGFEVVPVPFIFPVSDALPPEVGASYEGPTLFLKIGNTYEAQYKESLAIINYLFPKDKNILLMCGGAGYAGMMRDFLLTMGWPQDKIYNTGGYWSYKGNYDVPVKRINESGETVYDFYKVSYHDINFTTLEAL